MYFSTHGLVPCNNTQPMCVECTVTAIECLHTGDADYLHIPLHLLRRWFLPFNHNCIMHIYAEGPSRFSNLIFAQIILQELLSSIC